MTTITWDGTTLAADRRASHVGGSDFVTKIRRLSDGRLVGAAGISACCELWMHWREHGGEMPALLKPKDSGTDTTADGIEIHPGGKVFIYGKYGPVPIESPFTAVGSGKPFALGAMAMGANAILAVEVAARFDRSTGGGVDYLTF